MLDKEHAKHIFKVAEKKSWSRMRIQERQKTGVRGWIMRDIFVLKEQTDRTGSIFKPGLHLGLDCGL